MTSKNRAGLFAQHWYLRIVSCALLFAVSCDNSGAKPKADAGETWEGVCIDVDQDGFGVGCSSGRDCDDNDPSVSDDCSTCTAPRTGCECEADTAPVDCAGESSVDATGSLLCREGTRYCRDGKWSACESIRTFEAPSRSLFVQLQGRAWIGADASVPCSPCSPDCLRVDDDFSSLDAGSDAGVAQAAGGGITLSTTTTFVDGGLLDGGSIVGIDTGVDAGLLDDPLATCVPGTSPDRDCDGIADVFDPYPDARPFTTSHNTIFMDLAPGQSRDSTFDVNFSLRTADIYFYLDMTRSMEDERDNLIQSLTTGNFLPLASQTSDCADHDFDGTPDNYLKTQGVAGNIYCLIRDSALGAGWFRDVPFVGPYGGANQAAPYVAPSDFAMFENRQDISTDIGSLLTQLQGFTTAGNYNVPEGSMQGLYSIATGSELYAGWDRPGIPSRTDCATGRWGYPCFRQGSFPVVIHITDAPLQNGPATASNKLAVLATKRCTTTPTTAYSHPVNYDSSVLSGVKPATGSTYYHLTSSAESFATAQDVGTVDSRFVTYVGDTSTMNSDLTYASTGTCPSGSAWDTTSQSGTDAVFKFRLTAPKTVTISTRGTRFDSSLLLVKSSAALTSSVSSTATNNGVAGSAFDLGSIPGGQRTFVSESTSTSAAVYPREGMEVAASGGCFSGANANDLQGASVVKFRLAQDTNLKFTTTSSTGAVSALYSSAPVPADTRSLSAINCGSGTASNCNDKLGQYNVGDVAGKYIHLTDGDTSSSNLTNDFTAAQMTAAGCSNAYNASKDAVVDFSLSKPTTVRIETTGTSNTLAADFSHGLALLSRSASGTPLVRNVSNNGDLATAAVITESDINSVTAGTWVRYTGSSASDVPTYGQNDVGGAVANVCHNNNAGGATAARDVVFKFVVTTSQNYEFDTTPAVPSAGYPTWLSLHKDTINTTTTRAISNAAELDTAQGQAAATAVQGAIDFRQVTLTGGQMDQRDRSYAPSTMGLNCGSTANSANGGRDAVFAFRANSAATINIRTVGSNGTGTPAFDSFFAVYRGSISLANLVSGTCPTPWLLDWNANNQAGNGWSKSIAVTAGNDYFVVVKEWAFATSLSAANGQFGLVIEDSRYANSFLGCDAGSASNTQYSKINTTLSPGTYYAVIKGTGAGANNTFSLNVRKPAVSGGTFTTCSNDSSGRAAIEQTLAAGDYSVVVKGQKASSCFFFVCSDTTSQGHYNLTLRDLGAAPKPVACNNSDKGQTSFTQNALKAQVSGQPVDYYLVTRGTTSNGDFNVAIEDTSIAASVPNACDDNGAPAVGVVPSCYDSSLEGDTYAQVRVTNLAAGDYFAVLKGHTAADKGLFQISIGNNESPAATTTMAAKTWLGPAGDGVGGVRAALLDKGIRVITVNSSADTYLAEQARTLSRETLAVDKNGNPLTFTIAPDGTGLGSAVVQAVTDLVGTLSMDLSVQLVESPDDPTPNFGLLIQAIQQGTNSCTSVADRDGDAAHVPDTHVGCRPGSVPRFKVTFTNPAGAGAVPPNPADPVNGGYNMKLQLIGDGKYVVDEIPVYIVPRSLAPSTPAPATPVTLYAPTGVYEQTIDTNCGGTQAPRWDALAYDATIPANTSVTWEMCSGQSASEVANCTLKPVGVVTSGLPCVTSATCTNGYCDASGVCQYVAGPACTSTADCGRNGVCAGGTCRFSATPIGLKAALNQGLQGKSKMRVRASLTANAARTAAPTVQDWRLIYTCLSQE